MCEGVFVVIRCPNMFINTITVTLFNFYTYTVRDVHKNIKNVLFKN